MQKPIKMASDRILEKLEFVKVRQLLRQECTSESSKEFAERIQPVADKERVLRFQKETSEAVQILHSTLEIPLGGIVDVRQPLRKLRVDGVLAPEDFLRIGRTLYATRRLKEFLENPQRRFELDHLAPYSTRLMPVPEVEKEIERIFNDEGDVADNASDKLASLRRRITGEKQGIRHHMENILRQSTMQDHLQDNLITMRGDRFVIPVKAEHRARVPGIVHDQSASGATLYIEPLAVVERHNAIQKMEMDEAAEIQRILEELSAMMRPHVGVMQNNFRTLVYLDFTFAKARLSDKMQGTEPDSLSDASLVFYRARHPLIDAETVVPIDVSLGVEADCLVITGPNTGGKTVTLKTVGLLVLMYQAGLHIPVALGSGIGIFGSVYADIGDEQSIEQSLSTFSSHITNISSLLTQAGDDSLILYDELGAGTDPTEGASLAVAILEHSLALGSKIIATTHYGELKNFAFETPRVQNASVEFDVDSLRPTYRLLMGVTGNSNAFDISARIGLPAAIIDRAKEYVEETRSESDRLLSDLESAQYEVARRQESLEKTLEDLNAREAALDARERSMIKSSENIVDQAKERAANILSEARRNADEVVKELRTLQKAAPLEAAQQASALRRELSDSAYELRRSGKKKPVPQGAGEKDVAPGDRVHLVQFGSDGTVLTEPDKDGDFQVQAGIMKVTVNLKDVILRPEKTQGTKFRKQSTGAKVSALSTELDLRGKTVDEALPVLDKYLDDAYLNALPQVTIIHGKGTGALRNMVQQKLRGVSHISGYRLGNFDEGGDGVTVVTIK